jgi:hypothetical protein
VGSLLANHIALDEAPRRRQPQIQVELQGMLATQFRPKWLFLFEWF